MSSKIFTSKFRVLHTPVKASELAIDEVIVATDAEGGVLFTFMQDGKETLYDASESPEGACPIHFSTYREITDSK
jgi:hypothetical protein